jgi:iron(III) transport system ATP-binding protein
VPDIHVVGLTKSFGTTRVLEDVTFSADDGELVTLLGPSGCGKTTTLMSIAGLEIPDQGSIICGDTTFFDAPTKIEIAAESRNLGIVFQTYAIWPHMTVAENVAFPLRIRRRSQREIAERVAEVLDLVEMGTLGKRYPYQLSGGQQQRVALARALAHSPDVLLLDEPFSNLDAKLRERARIWFRHLQLRLGLTTIFVTHDQDEALSMSDRIMVMEGGRIVQHGAPEAIYREPATRFAAAFVGQCNFLVGRVVDSTQNAILVAVDGFDRPVSAISKERHAIGTRVTLAVRPENVHLASSDAPATGPNVWSGRLEAPFFFGDRYRAEATIGTLQVITQTRRRPRIGEVTVAIDPADLVVLTEAGYCSVESKSTPDR